MDVGIDEFMVDGSPSSEEVMNRNGLISGQGVPEITYIHIYECDQFSVSTATPCLFVYSDFMHIFICRCNCMITIIS